MSTVSYVQCPKCQATSPVGAAFCFRCGGTLEIASPTAGSLPAPGSPPLLAPTRYDVLLGPAPSPFTYELRRGVDRTRTGVGLLAIGALLSWISAIGFLGSLISLAGAILVILGRAAFDERHARNVGIAIVLFLIGIVGSFALVEDIFFSISDAVQLPPAQAQAAIQDAFNTLLTGGIVVGIISGLASVLFLWELLSFSGRALILLSYTAAIGVQCVVYVLVASQIGAAVSSAFSGSTPNLGPLEALDAQLNDLRLLQILPAALSAAAAYVAWSRIEAGEIPKRPTGTEG